MIGFAGNLFEFVQIWCVYKLLVGGNLTSGRVM